tara:strand:- start:10486 stop:13542 length:3057 start_codon:yes stop_codon:yes gene_type:complete
MSCKELIPQISIDGIFIKENPNKVSSTLPFSFSKNADEAFTATISHTNLVQIDSFADGFSIFDLLDATVGSPDLYGIKFLFTNSAEKAKLIENVINVSKQVSFYLYAAPMSTGASQNATPEEVQSFIKQTPADAPAAAKGAVEDLNTCISDMLKDKKKANVASLLTTPSANIEAIAPEPDDNIFSQFAPDETKTVITLRDRIISAVNDNASHSFNIIRDKIGSFTTSFTVDKQNIMLKGEDYTPTFVNSQESAFMFADTQLKDLYLFIVPNIEYRENNDLIFTVRDYFSIPLVINFQPQTFGNEQKVGIEFLQQRPVIDPALLIASKVDKVLQIALGNNGYQTWTNNLNPESFISEPLVSVGYDGAVNGLFFLNQKTLAKNLTSYQGVLEQPALYNNIIEGITIKKEYANGEEVELPPPEAYESLTFHDGMVIGYRFKDVYDIRDFSYVIDVNAKNPMEYFLNYVMPNLTYGKTVVDDLITNITTSSKTDPLVVFNPVSGFFTDDFLQSDAYKSINDLYVNYVLESLENLYNFLLPGDMIDLKDSILAGLDQLYTAQQYYDSLIKTIQDIADTECVILSSQSSYSSKKKSNKDYEPYKVLTQKYIKSYISPSSPVFYDFLYRQPLLNRSGFEINPTDMVARVDLESDLLNYFGVNETSNAYTEAQPISITPLSISIDRESVDLVADLENLEEITTNVLLAAELEVKDPSRTFSEESNTIAQLLQLDGTQAVDISAKTLKAQLVKDNFIPTEVANNQPSLNSGMKFIEFDINLKNFAQELNRKAKKELEEGTAKSLYLDAADYDPYIVQTAALLKTVLDVKHGETATKLGIPSYKVIPATYITRLMNSYQLEYISGYNMTLNKPIYSPLTANVLGSLTQSYSIVVKIIMKAGLPISKDYTMMHTYFIVSLGTTSLQPAPPLQLFPFVNLTDVKKSILNISALKTNSLVKQAKKMKTAVGGLGAQTFEKKTKIKPLTTPSSKIKKVAPKKKTPPKPKVSKVKIGGIGKKGGFGGGGGGYF